MTTGFIFDLLIRRTLQDDGDGATYIQAVGTIVLCNELLEAREVARTWYFLRGFELCCVQYFEFFDFERWHDEKNPVGSHLWLAVAGAIQLRSTVYEHGLVVDWRDKPSLNRLENALRHSRESVVIASDCPGEFYWAIMVRGVFINDVVPGAAGKVVYTEYAVPGLDLDTALVKVDQRLRESEIQLSRYERGFLCALKSRPRSRFDRLLRRRLRRGKVIQLIPYVCEAEP